MVLLNHYVENFGDTLIQKEDIQTLKPRIVPGGLHVSQMWVHNDKHVLWELVPQWEELYHHRAQRSARGPISYNTV